MVRLHWLDSSFQEFKKETPLFAFRIIHTNDEQPKSVELTLVQALGADFDHTAPRSCDLCSISQDLAKSVHECSTRCQWYAVFGNGGSVQTWSSRDLWVLMNTQILVGTTPVAASATGFVVHGPFVSTSNACRRRTPHNYRWAYISKHAKAKVESTGTAIPLTFMMREGLSHGGVIDSFESHAVFHITPDLRNPCALPQF